MRGVLSLVEGGHPLRRCLLALLLADLAALALPASAAAASLYSSVRIGPFSDPSRDTSENGTSLAQVTGYETIFFPGDPPRANFVGSGAALAGYGSLGIFASLNIASYVGGYFTTSTLMHSEARVQDLWTVTGGAGQGSVRLHVGLEGEMAATEEQAVVPYVALNVTTPETNVLSVGGTLVNPAGDYLTDPIPFTFGTPFLINFILYGGAQKVDPNDNVTEYLGVFAQSNYGSTATITVEEVRDAQGELVSDFSLATESGGTYGAPEPAQVLLVLTGGLVLAAVRRRRAVAVTSAHSFRRHLPSCGGDPCARCS